jgi:hypothetical protein
VKTLGAPLDKLSADAKLYPVHLLREGDTGLVLFAAAFLGVNDAIHMARMDMTASCIDIDRGRLYEMRELYPDDWEFVHADAWEFATQAQAEGRQWDVVSADTWTGGMCAQSLASLPLWCSLARRLVTVTITPLDVPIIPDGWRAAHLNRSELADWLVLTR